MCAVTLVSLSTGAELDGPRPRLYPYERMAEAHDLA